MTFVKQPSIPACLILGILLASPAMATESSSASSAASASLTLEAQRAVDIAKTKLATDLKLAPEGIQLVSAEPHTWPNSGLGCAKPGSMTAQVMTPGYIITFSHSNKKYIVHATEKYAVRCDQRLIVSNPRSVGVPLRNLDAMIDKAKADLAEKLNAQPSTIRTLRFTPAEWPDTSMECVVADEAVEQKATRGYRIALNHVGRVYIYHTDMERVRACPAIAVE